MKDQAVIFLARGIGHGTDAVEEFFASYDAHPAGLPHHLLVLAKGWEGVPGRERLDVLAHQHNATVINLPDDGFDWGAYMRAVPQIKEEWVCFLNTHSRILADGWLAKLRAAAEQPGVGAAGATGSWGTLAPVYKFIGPTIRDIFFAAGVMHALMKASYIYMIGYPLARLQNLGQLPPFPNPHLRSNGFLLKRELFLKYSHSVSFPFTKRDAFTLESGWASMTRFLETQSLTTAVVGVSGKTYKPDEWIESHTFRVPGQTNLLISDNQTQAYEAAEISNRLLAEASAWGRTITPIKLIENKKQ